MSTVRSNWLEQALPDGRKYWYNMTNGESVWEEPAELKASPGTVPTTIIGTMAPPRKSSAHASSSSSDIAASWRELTAANGRKYYYNAVTKVSMWEVPREYAEYLERVRDPASMDRDALEAKFLALLKDAGITSKHSWEEALRLIFGHPHYKLVPTLAERKTLFARYIDLQREVEREERHQRAAKARQDFLELLRNTPTITGTTRYSEALEQLEEEAAFQAVENPKERASLFDEYVAVVRREEAETGRQRRRRATEKYQKLLESLSAEIRVDTTWRTARDLLKAHADMASDEDLRSMEPMDLLVGFENHIKYLERKAQREAVAQRREQRRQERLARQAFKRLLAEMTEKGVLTATTSWKQLFPLLKERPELEAAISQPGSTPLDLFWDHLHLLQMEYVERAKLAVEALKTGDSLGEEGWLERTTVEHVERVARQLGLSSPPHMLNALLSHLLPSAGGPTSSIAIPLSAEHRQRIGLKVDELRRDRRQQIDRLKGCIKRFQPPIQLDSSFAVFGPLIKAHPSGAEIGDDEVIMYYFDKYIRHLRKKAGFLDADQHRSDPDD